MLHEARQRHVVRRRELGDRETAPVELPEHGAPGRVGQRRKHGIELGFVILNHSV